jgi:hypothetical protein
MNESRRSASPRREPAAAIPKFHKLGISAVVAACAWERKPLQEPRERSAAQDGEERHWRGYENTGDASRD